MASSGRKWVLNHGKIWKKMSKQISVKKSGIVSKKQQDVRLCPCGIKQDYILWTWCFAKLIEKSTEVKFNEVMLVNGSSHLHGTTMTALEEMIKVFHSEEVETEVVQLGGKPIADCLQCNVCQKTGKCVIKDDGVNEFVEKAKTADGFVFATPVYFAHPSGRIYDFLDRVFYSAGGYDAFKFKPGAAVAVARRGGTTAALDGINKYFGIAQMPVAGSTYWNMVHGLYGEEASQDEEGMQTMRNLARNMIWMMRCFKLGRESGILYPETETDACTNFIKRSDTLR
mgnify:CR=1 FL=1